MSPPPRQLPGAPETATHRTSETDQQHERETDANTETLRALLEEVGRVYVPALLANAAAVDQGADEVRTEIDGREWVQQPFPYQAKCLQWIRHEYARLDGEDRIFVDEVLADTGCEQLLTKR